MQRSTNAGVRVERYLRLGKEEEDAALERTWKKEGVGRRIFPSSRPSREGFIKIERRC